MTNIEISLVDLGNGRVGVELRDGDMIVNGIAKVSEVAGFRELMGDRKVTILHRDMDEDDVARLLGRIESVCERDMV